MALRTVQEIGQAVETVQRELVQIRDACRQHRQDWLAGRVDEVLDMFAEAVEPISEDRIRAIIAEELQAALGSAPVKPLTYEIDGVPVTFLTQGGS